MMPTDEALKAIAAKAIFEAMTADSRALLLQQALSHLMTPAKPSYGSGPAVSPLQTAFNDAVEHVARQEAHKMLDSPEVQAQLQTLMLKAWHKMMEEEHASPLVDAMAKAFSRLRVTDY